MQQTPPEAKRSTVLLEVGAILGALSASWILYLGWQHWSIYFVCGVCSLVLICLTFKRLHWLFIASRVRKADSSDHERRPHGRKLDSKDHL